MKHTSKVIEHPEALVGRIRKETTKAAGVINRELEALAKKFPDHIFEVTIDRQQLGPKTMYRVNIKTFKREKQ